METTLMDLGIIENKMETTIGRSMRMALWAEARRKPHKVLFGFVVRTDSGSGARSD